MHSHILIASKLNKFANEILNYPPVYYNKQSVHFDGFSSMCVLASLFKYPEFQVRAKAMITQHRRELHLVADLGGDGQQTVAPKVSNTTKTALSNTFTPMPLCSATCTIQYNIHSRHQYDFSAICFQIFQRYATVIAFITLTDYLQYFF